MRQVILIFIAAVLVGHDLYMRNGYYVHHVTAEVASWWNAAESFISNLI